MVAAYGLFLNKNWATTILSIATAILLITFIALAFHILEEVFMKENYSSHVFQNIVDNWIYIGC
jgi:hypothetical protein